MKLVRRICVLLILLAITIGLMSAANAQTVNSIYDTNADGKVDLLDVTQTQRWFGTDYPTCDVDDDDEVSISDMLYIANAMGGQAFCGYYAADSIPCAFCRIRCGV